MARASKSQFILWEKGLLLLCHIPALAVPVVHSPHALKAEIIPVHPPEQGNTGKPHLEPQGLSALACSWGFFICHLLMLLNNDHKPVTVHTRSKSLFLASLLW